MAKYTNIDDAVHAFVYELNAFPLSMIETLAQDRWEEWEECTVPCVGDRFEVWDDVNIIYPDDDLSDVGSSSDCGEIVGYDAEDDMYTLEFDDGVIGRGATGTFDVVRDDYFPMWGTLWQFKDPCDDWWLEEKGGIRIMSECGFRIYHHDEWGYFFGIDGAGYDFFEAHWTPLYKARGLKWHEGADS
jgi:hypothetical protein